MREQRDALQQLLKSAGWAEVERILDAWIQNFEKQLNESPCYDSRDMAERNVQIGEARGYRAVRGLPQKLVDNLNEFIDAAVKEESDNERRSDDYYEGHPDDD